MQNKREFRFHTILRVLCFLEKKTQKPGHEFYISIYRAKSYCPRHSSKAQIWTLKRKLTNKTSQFLHKRWIFLLKGYAVFLFSLLFVTHINICKRSGIKFFPSEAKYKSPQQDWALLYIFPDFKKLPYDFKMSSYNCLWYSASLHSYCKERHKESFA